MVKTLFRITFIISILILQNTAGATPLKISGTFGGIGELFGNLPAAAYPFPKLFGGTFEGMFSYNPSLPPINVNSTNKEYRLQDVSIDIVDNTGVTINTITNMLPENNVMKLRQTGDIFSLVFGFSAELPFATEDLRLEFSGNFTVEPTGPTISEINAATFKPYPSGNSFLETDNDKSFESWDLGVLSANISVVPNAAAIWLIGSGMFGLLGLSRNKS